MKTTLTIQKTAIIAAAFMGLVARTPAAPPTSIGGTISFSGKASIDSANFVTATRFTLFQDVFVDGAGLSGDYAGTGGAAVTIAPFIWNPPNASTPLNPLWIFISGGNTYSFDLSILHEDFASPTSLLLSGMGTAHITGPAVGKIDTVGRWDFSAKTEGVATFSFSSTAAVPAPVPDTGSTLALLGASLAGMAFIRRKQIG